MPFEKLIDILSCHAGFYFIGIMQLQDPEVDVVDVLSPYAHIRGDGWVIPYEIGSVFLREDEIAQ